MTGYPDSIPRSVGGKQRVVLSLDHHAVRGARGAAAPDRVVATIDGDDGTRFTVLRGALPEFGADARGASPVYVDRAARTIAVPTGRVFVRFAAGVDARSEEEALVRAGYRIAGVIDYAPEALWLVAADGDTAAALRGLDRLATVPGVVNVEPQLLATRALR